MLDLQAYYFVRELIADEIGVHVLVASDTDRISEAK